MEIQLLITVRYWLPEPHRGIHTLLYGSEPGVCTVGGCSLGLLQSRTSGEIICFSSYRKKRLLREEKELEKQIAKLEAVHINNPDPGVLQALLQKRYEFNTKISLHARTAHLRDSAVMYSDSNRAGRRWPDTYRPDHNVL